MIDIYVFGALLMVLAAIILGVIFWDELVDVAAGFKRRGHRKQHDGERTVRLPVQPPRARARVPRVPRQRGPRHRRQ